MDMATALSDSRERARKAARGVNELRRGQIGQSTVGFSFNCCFIRRVTGKGRSKCEQFANQKSCVVSNLAKRARPIHISSVPRRCRPCLVVRRSPR